MLANIPSHAKDYAQRMLMLLCYAKRPLRIDEVICGIAVELGATPRFNPKRQLVDEIALQEVCPGFTEVDWYPYGDYIAIPPVIRIAHFSVREYLESDRIKQHKDVESFGLVKKDAHSQIARICLTTWLNPELGPVEGHFDLSHYSRDYWPTHFKNGGNDQSVEIQALEIFQGPERPDSDSSTTGWDVYYIAHHNLYSILSRLLDETRPSCTPNKDAEAFTRSLDSICRHNETPLASASAQGHKEIVQLLVEKGANVNARKSRRKLNRPWVYLPSRMKRLNPVTPSALENASCRGHIGIVQFLLEKGAHTGPQNSDMQAAIQYASKLGHEEIVRLLVEHGADVNVRTGGTGSAVQLASEGGHLSIVKFLVEHGANVKSPPGRYGSAIQRGIMWGASFGRQVSS